MLNANSSKIACVLVTHLPVKAEIRRYPELRGKPVVITESYGSKNLVLDSSPQARGLAPGMPLQEAMAQCKEAVLLQADCPHYNDAFDNLVRSLEMRSPLVEKAGMGCAYVGLEGLDPGHRLHDPGGAPRVQPACRGGRGEIPGLRRRRDC